MIGVRRIAAMVQSAGWYASASAINSGVRLATVVFAARTLPQEGFAQIDLLLYLLISFSSLALCGQDSAALRFGVSRPESMFGQSILTSALGIAAFGHVVLVLASGLLYRLLDSALSSIDTLTLVGCMAVFSFGWTLAAICGSHLRAHFRPKQYFLGTCVSALLRFAGLGLLLLGTDGWTSVSSLAVVVAVTQLLAGLVFAALAGGLEWPRWPGRPLVTEMLAFGLPLCGVVAVSTLYPAFERGLTERLAGHQWFVWYAAGAMPATLLASATQFLNLVWVPFALKDQISGDGRLIRLSALLGVLMTFGGYLLLLLGIQPVMILLLGEANTESMKLFPFIGLSAVLRLLSTISSIGLILGRKTVVKFTLAILSIGVSGILAITGNCVAGPEAIPFGLFLGQFVCWIAEAYCARRACPSTRMPIGLMIAVIVIAAIPAYLASEPLAGLTISAGLRWPL